eukprot:jgi/Tetstr1/444195/TSEL_032089.t1
MGFILDDLPTSHLSEATLRNLLGGVIDLNVMRNYIKAVSGAATAPPVTTVCHASHGTFISSEGEACVLIDSGASSHVNDHRTDYVYYMDIPAAEQFLVGGFGQPAIGIGTTLAPTLDITGMPHTIVARDCYHTPNITSSVGLTNISRLLSTHQLSKHGYSYYFTRLSNSMITTLDGAVIHLQPYPGTTRLHGIKLLPIRDPSHGHQRPFAQHACIKGKSRQQSVNQQPSPRATAPYVLVVIDDWKGPCPSVTGAQHVFGAVDSYTGVKVAITMRTKDEAVRAVHQLHAVVLGMCHAIQRIRADRSAVYTGSPFRQACADLNIALEFTASHSYHQAGLSERSFRTIGECAQAMLLHAGLDRTFWDWAHLHAVYLCNRQWSSSVNAIPHTLMTGRKPDLTNLHVFGCVAWVNILVSMRAAMGKMTPKSWPGIYGGHHEDSAGYRIYNPATKRETVTSDYHPTLVASAIAEVVRPYSAQMAALALPAPTVRASKAPRNYKEAISRNHPDDWKQSMDRPIIIQTAWAFAEKHDKDGNLIKRKAGVVVRGDQLTAGENYDAAKTYAPVVSFIALRTTIALAVQLEWQLHQFDVTCAFLNANLDEDVYVYPPPPPGYSRKDQAWKLKALYGLPQAPKAWFLRFSSFLRDFGFISLECDPGVWTLLAADGSLLAILCVYEKYIYDILTTFNMTECKPRRLPFTPDTDFHDPTCAPLDTKLFPYPNLVGSLIWLAVASRPDIAFVVCQLCAYTPSPTERHWQIAISVLRYPKGTPSHGLIFWKQLDNGAPDFIFFVDADWAAFVPKRRSTTGYLALVHGTPVAYHAQVQNSVAMSTAEAEFVALCMACKCLAFIRILLRQLSHPTTDPMRVCEDN